MASRLSREMSGAECRALLESQRVCVVSLVDGEEPYGVPVFYGLGADVLVFGLSEGRKTRVLDGNARVCVTIVDVQPDGMWRSVQVQGRAESLTSDADRAAAIETLKAHNRRLGHAPPSGGGHRPVAPGRLVRVATTSVSGRARA
ncbi:MAG TPA: pyridoxamine 5'-phosphate oxidase family protein [Gemmatimonadaceae bacterium]|nr:pyridoxamine 5'-phosphate oxidase family protein [Gemmatimonadaceae bacterium]